MGSIPATVHNPCNICGATDHCYRSAYNGEMIHFCAKSVKRNELYDKIGRDGRRYLFIKEASGGYAMFIDEEEKLRAREEWKKANGYGTSTATKKINRNFAAYSEYVSEGGGTDYDAMVSSEIKSEEELDKIYRRLLELCTLEPIHFKSVSKEWDSVGRTQEWIKKYHIASMPVPDALRFKMIKANVPYFKNMRSQSRKAIFQKLVDEFGDLTGVPGFYMRDDGSWTGSSLSGIIYPVPNIKGQIIRIRIKDNFPSCKGSFDGMYGDFQFSTFNGTWTFTQEWTGDDERKVVVVYDPVNKIYLIDLDENFLPILKDRKIGGKYKNYSSAKAKMNEKGEWYNTYKNGTRSGSMPAIYCEPDDDFSVVYFPEGEKKGIVTHELYNAPAVSLPGVGLFNLLLDGDEPIIKSLVENGAKEGVVVYDADKHENLQVMKNEAGIILTLNEYLKMNTGEWDARIGKGIDDVALIGFRPEKTPVDINALKEKFKK